MEMNNANQQVSAPATPNQNIVREHPVKNQRGNFPIILGVFVLLLVVGSGAYYLGTQNNNSKNSNSLTTNPQTTSELTTTPVTPTVNPTNDVSQPTQKPASSNKSITIPSNWKQFTATDPDFGVKTTMSMPPGYSFRFTGSEFIIQNDSDATELWDYSTSVFIGKDGQKNYYAGQSRRAWYQDLLDGDFMAEKPATFTPGKIANAVEHQIGSQTYYEMTVSGGPPANYSGEVGKHFVYVQNGIVHILKPASHKANTAEAKIPQNIGAIFISLSSSQIK
jgi:hypothetical protein